MCDMSVEYHCASPQAVGEASCFASAAVYLHMLSGLANCVSNASVARTERIMP